MPSLKFSLFAIYAFISMVLITNCARESSPTGGPTDTEPPKAVRFNPPNFSTHFRENRFTVKFDEYITLDKISDELVVSPPLSEAPKTKVRGKKLVVRFPKDTLKQDRTYIFNFNNAIADNNEKNLASQFRYAFSTGDVIDSLKVEGHIFRAIDNTPAEAVSVFLYSNLADSAPRKTLPDYVAKTDKTGFFSFNSLADKEYRIFAIDDMNRNMLFDQPIEKIAFGSETIKPGAEYKLVIDTLTRDSIFTTTDERGYLIKQRIKLDSIVKEERTVFWPTDVNLFLFDNNENKQYITHKSRKRPELFTFGFHQPLKDNFFQISSPQTDISEKQYRLEEFKTKDSLCVWLTDTSLINNDSLKLTITYKKNSVSDSLVNDTLAMRYIKSHKKGKTQKELTTNLNGSTYNLNDSLLISLTKPVEKIEASKLKLYETDDSLGFRNNDGVFYELDTNETPIITDYHKHLFPVYYADSAYKQQGIKKSQRIKHRFYVKLKKPIEESGVEFELAANPSLKNWYIKENDLSENIVYCWITDSSVLSMKDQRINAVFNQNSGTSKKQLLFDEFVFKKNPSPKIDKLDLQTIDELCDNLFLDEYLLILGSNPIESFDTSKISLINIKDSLQEPLPIECFLFENEPMRLWLKHSWQANSTYELKIKKGAITDIFGLENKDLVVAVKTQKKKNNKVRTEIPAEFSTISNEIRNISVSAQFEANKKYEIAMGPGAITDIYGSFTDSLIIPFGTLPTDQYGILTFDCKNVSEEYILVLEKENGEEVNRYIINTDQKLKLPNLQPAKYLYYVIEDSNKNGKWDNGNYDEATQAEKQFFIEEAVEIKKDWEVEMPINFRLLKRVKE